MSNVTESQVTKSEEELLGAEIQELYDEVVAKREAFDKAGESNPAWQTDLRFGFNASTPQVRELITSITDERKLVTMLAFVLDREAKYAEAADKLGSDKTFTWLNYTVQEWESDLKVCMDRLKRKEREAELKEAEAGIAKILTPTLRKKLELVRLKKLIRK